jgi:hypothetical protein
LTSSTSTFGYFWTKASLIRSWSVHTQTVSLPETSAAVGGAAVASGAVVGACVAGVQLARARPAVVSPTPFRNVRRDSDFLFSAFILDSFG